MALGCRATARIMGVGLNTILRHLKNLQAAVGNLRIQPAVTSSSARKWDEQRGYVGNRAPALAVLRV